MTKKKEEFSPEPDAVEPEIVQAPDSPTKAAFRKHIERYATQNPKKFAIKEQALLKKLNTL